jgi:hypothetical protein
MPSPQTIGRAQRDRRQGKTASTQAGEFIREEIHDIRAGKHGARSPQQAIAIGLSKARRAGVALKPPAAGKATSGTRRRAASDYALGQRSRNGRSHSARRAAASERTLRGESRASGSASALAIHARAAASRRSKADRSVSAKRAAQTKGAKKRSAAARQAARTRAARAASRDRPVLLPSE